MKVGLFIPCFMDMLFPEAAMASLELLEKLGVNVEYPQQQTCCGQPMANTGCNTDAKAAASHFISTFKDYDYIVSPSGSCTAMVRQHYHGLAEEDKAWEHVTANTYELCEFLVDILKVEKLDSAFRHKVGYHSACHGLRELRLAQSSERQLESFSKPEKLLHMVQGIELVKLNRPDECCGFGGTFAVAEESVSCSMGNDRINDHKSNGAEYIVSTDSSCLMHMDGLIRRQKGNLKVLHISQVLNGAKL